MGNAPAPRQQAMQPVQAQARLAVVPGPAENLSEPVPHQAVVTIPGAEYIFSVVAAPASNDLFILAETKDDPYGGTYFLVHPDAPGQRVEEVMSGTNLTDPDAPVWNADGTIAYFVFDDGKEPPDPSTRGLYAFDLASGRFTRILADSIGGLAISPDGALLAFWDYSAGDQLTVYNAQRRQVVRRWPGQVHSADDLVIRDLAFTPDGKSVLARIYAKENPLMGFEIATGTTSLFAKNVQSVVDAGNNVYFLQFEPVPFANPEHPHTLMHWAMGAPGPVTVVEDLPGAVQLSGGRRWLVAQKNTGGTAIDDLETGEIKSVGGACDTAVVSSGGEVLYIYGGELISDVADCNSSETRLEAPRRVSAFTPIHACSLEISPCT